MSHERENLFSADEEFVTRFFCLGETDELTPRVDSAWEAEGGCSAWSDMEVAESLLVAEVFEPEPLARNMRDRLVAHTVVSERRAKDRRQSQTALQSFVFGLLMLISPWISWNIVNQSTFQEVRLLLCEAMISQPRMALVNVRFTRNGNDPEQEFIDQLANNRERILFSLPGMVAPTLGSVQ